MLGFILLITCLLLTYAWRKEKDRADISYQQGYEDGLRASTSKTIENPELVQKKDDEFVSPTWKDVKQSVQPAKASDYPAPDYENFIPSLNSNSGLNALLFTASLLFVAAAAAFVNATMPASIKLTAIWMIVAAFYVVGMKLHSSDKLRPAGIAFIGTGLGALPFAGIGLHELANIPGEVSWFITSLIGVAAYFYAAIKLNSQFVSYLTLAFVVSLAASFGDTLSLPIIWTFVLIIGLSLVLNIVSLVKPSWVPEVFKQPIDKTSKYLTPITLTASLFAGSQMSVLHYEILLAVAAAQYLVQWLQTKQFIYEQALRVLLQILAFVIIGDVFTDGVAIGLSLLSVAAVHQAYSLWTYKRQDKQRHSTEFIWIHALQLVQLFAIIAWSGSQYDQLLNILALGTIGVSSLVLALRSRSSFAAISGLVASIAIPFELVSSQQELAADYLGVGVWFLAASLIITYAWRNYIEPLSLNWQQFMRLAFGIYLAIAVIIFFLQEKSLAGVALLFGAGSVAWLMSYRSRIAWISVIGSAIFGLAFVEFWQLQVYSPTWMAIGVAACVSAIVYPLYLYQRHTGDVGRATLSLLTVWTYLAFAVIASIGIEETKLASALIVIALALTVFYEGKLRANKNWIEASVYLATTGLQVLASIALPELNAVAYAHWWAATIASMALWQSDNRTTRLAIAAGFITSTTGLYALAEGGQYQLLFLAEHLALLVTGVLLRKTWAIYWGLIASTAAVMYFLQDIAYLSFTFLGLVLIGIALWRLKKSNNPEDNQKP